MKVLAVDPGKVTGVCLGVWRPGGEGPTAVTPLRWEQFPLEGLFKTMCQFVRVERPAAVVMESVVLHGALTPGKVAQIIAAAQVECAVSLYLSDPLLWVTPEQRKRIRWVPEEIRGDHARDACRLLYCLHVPEPGIS